MSDDFYGMRTRSIGNNFLRVDFLIDAGPRIVRLTLAGSNENWMAELPNNVVPTPYGDFHFYGGHRLWHSPEAMPRTYYPDNQAVTVEQVDGGVRLLQHPEPHTGIRKSIEIRLKSDRAALMLVHELKNEGKQVVEFAPWAITQLKQGGIAILPQTIGPIDVPGLLPNRQFAMWPYTRVRDQRLEMHDDLVLMRAQPLVPACKIGIYDRRGWVGYQWNGALFLKRFQAVPDATYPDHGCNAEVYCNDQFVEVETLGPLASLQPGDSTTAEETWEFYTDLGSPQSLNELRAMLSKLHLA